MMLGTCCGPVLCSRSCARTAAAVGSRNSGDEQRTRSAARNASFVRCASSGPGRSSCGVSGFRASALSARQLVRCCGCVSLCQA